MKLEKKIKANDDKKKESGNIRTTKKWVPSTVQPRMHPPQVPPRVSENSSLDKMDFSELKKPR